MHHARLRLLPRRTWKLWIVLLAPSPMSTASLCLGAAPSFIPIPYCLLLLRRVSPATGGSVCAESSQRPAPFTRTDSDPPGGELDRFFCGLHQQRHLDGGESHVYSSTVGERNQQRPLRPAERLLST
ncbi:unnamed protein product [Citrullus colocynthis]|uniref:Secreted protein n=1 Tax=Citrullus colocynthis TaxID=252529 RepID=A0ABP0XPF2_9ROSI